MDQERRKFPRVPYGAWVEERGDAGGLTFYVAENLSIGGLLLKTRNAPPPLGNELRLRLVIENESRVMTVEGQVVRYMPGSDELSHFAVRFINMDAARQDFVRELVAENASENIELDE